ncbi:uncharacterized protein B0I36DRAFT_364017 [Microdochium trichocladiopsis]|uniref:Zn(2)-C6 fungal-type domain-containing protein n=1 Tax=Microdochium trichocladiopsis TaxID=1682393 RepID=A0A9P8Y7B6_9PEZI|nr:uncharacterized protein B0I36DRAFT_364017 [Microdochium trichocladiopsis]KAH7029481.1 hypothetical protein B0I36DRAFT_364017 [Microdochium trichocladiopsis]
MAPDCAVLPTARRKSCVACTRAKRRCDLVVPQCSRCVERQLDCVYTPVVSHRKRRAVHNNTSQQQQGSSRSSTAHPQPDFGFDIGNFCLDDTNMAPDMDNYVVAGDMAGMEACLLHPENLVPGGPGFDIMDSIFSTNLNNAASSLPMPFDFNIAVDSSNSFDPGKALVPPPKPFTFPHSPQTNSSPRAIYANADPRLQHAAEQFCSAPLQMVTSCHTPWSHPLLYTHDNSSTGSTNNNSNLPRSIAMAQACCALHIARNKANTGMITRNIIQRAREVCQEPFPSAATSSARGNDDDNLTFNVLARTQALLLFHIMLYLDNDALARETIQITGRELERAMVTLHERTRASSSPYPEGNEPPPPRSLKSLARAQEREQGVRSMLVTAETSAGSCLDLESLDESDDDEEAAEIAELLSSSPWLNKGALPPHHPPLRRPKRSAAPNQTATTTSHNNNNNNCKPQTTAKPMPVFLPVSPLTTTRPTWHAWILHESCRRTVLAAGIFQLLQQLLGGHIPKECPGLGSMLEFCSAPWTVSRECWDEAADAVDFAVGWNRRGWTVLRVADLEHGMPDISPQHIDTFSKMIITLLFGIDETKGWLLARGGTKS